MRHWMHAIAASAMAVATAAHAEPPVVVELFTSQGCSSCPPADVLLGKLAERDDVIALSLHVDYWDYIGWEDKFAQPRFTKRQKGYARAAGVRAIYTPQMIVGGRHHVVGHRPMEVVDLVRAHASNDDPVRLEVSSEGELVDIVVRAESRVGGDLLVHLVSYEPSETVDISKGENAGRSLTYHNIVTSWETIASWNGRDPLAMRHALPGDDPAVVLVQQANYGPILAAARVR